MTALWKRQAQRAEAEQARAELAASDSLALETVGWGKCDCDVDCGRWYDTDGMKWDEVPPSVFALAREVIRYRYAAMIPDPRGRVKLYCGRCGEWKPSDEERTLPEHHEKTHGARLVGSFEWMHSVGYGPLDEEETAR